MTDGVLDAIAQEYAKGRRLLVQTTNIDAQRPVIWDLSAIAASGQPDRRDLIVRVLLASTALPALFPAVRIRVNTDGHAYDELHVDGGVTAQIFFAPPRTRFARFEQMAFGRPRERTLYVIRNGKLTPDYKPTEERALPLATRSITTMTKYQGLSDLRRLDRIARETNARVLFTSIPPDFTTTARSEFDREYMSELFRVGEEMGRTGRAWRSGPPPAPALAL
jgi:predicted acylesterase/phospholipase RssA